MRMGISQEEFILTVIAAALAPYLDTAQYSG